MSHWTDLSPAGRSALPDPHAAPEFYDGVIAKRVLAWVVDIVLVTVLTLVAGVLTLTVGFFLWPLFFLAIGALYRVATIANRSATWGMRLMGIELRGHDGRRLDTLQALLHVSGYYASMIFVFPILASAASMVLTGRRQTLTDMVLGSAAINRPA